MTRRSVLAGLAALPLLAAATIACPAADERPSDYVDGMARLGFCLCVGPAGECWESDPGQLSPAQRGEELRLRAYWQATSARRQAVRSELRRRGLVITG